MPFAKRNQQGEIIALFSQAQVDVTEHVQPNDEDVLNFLISNSNQEGAKSYLSYTDTEMTRITEDIVDLLISKHVILLTDLPTAAQEKLNLRKRLRAKYLTENPLLLDDGII